MDRPTCKTCPYWDHVEGVRAGTCRRHAPKAFTDPDGTEISTFPCWPDTHDVEFCGEHPDFPEYVITFQASKEGRKS